MAGAPRCYVYADGHVVRVGAYEGCEYVFVFASEGQAREYERALSYAAEVRRTHGFVHAKFIRDMGSFTIDMRELKQVYRIINGAPAEGLCL